MDAPRAYGKQALRARWLVLAVASMAPVGQYYAFDNPSALNPQLRAAFTSPVALGGGGYSEERFEYLFNGLYTVYSLPNVVLPLVFGLLMDKVGINKIMLVLAGFLMLGQLLLCFGVAQRSFPLMLFARAVFGLGGESTTVAQTAFMSPWFCGKELAFALAVQLSVSRLGSVLNDVVAPAVCARLGLEAAMASGLLFVMLSAALTLAMVVMDRRADAALAGEAGEAEALVAAPSVAEELRSLAGGLAGFPRLYWMLVAVSVLLYSSLLPFNNVAAAVFVENQLAHLPAADAHLAAGRAMSLLFILPVILGPVAGLALDRTERPVAFMVGAAVATLCAHASALSAPPAATMLAFGMGYCLFATAVWPAIPQTVKDSQLGAAYGIATALQNLGMAVMPLVVAALRAHYGTYGMVEMAFVGLAGAALAAALSLQAAAWHARHQLVLGVEGAKLASFGTALKAV